MTSMTWSDGYRCELDARGVAMSMARNGASQSNVSEGGVMEEGWRRKSLAGSGA